MKNPKLLVLVLIAGLALAACSPAGEQPVPGTGQNQLAGTAWVLETLDGAPPLVGTEITASFMAGDEPALTGNGGCNSYSAPYQISGANITFTDAVATEMFCMEPAGVTEQEQRYFAALRDASQYQLSGGRLELRDAAGQARLVFRSQ